MEYSYCWWCSLWMSKDPFSIYSLLLSCELLITWNYDRLKYMSFEKYLGYKVICILFCWCKCYISKAFEKLLFFTYFCKSLETFKHESLAALSIHVDRMVQSFCVKKNKKTSAVVPIAQMPVFIYSHKTKDHYIVSKVTSWIRFITLRKKPQTCFWSPKDSDHYLVLNVWCTFKSLNFVSNVMLQWFLAGHLSWLNSVWLLPYIPVNDQSVYIMCVYSFC